MNELQVFNFQDLNKEVRTSVDESNNIWFCLKDAWFTLLSGLKKYS
jgi:prophage antirepressor-like protein